MTGLKSGSGDDLWGDEGEDDAAESSGDETATDDTDVEEAGDARMGSQRSPSRTPASDDDARDESSDSTSRSPRSGESDGGGGTDEDRPYVIRRAIQDKSVQFEREERLTFFVHDDVAEGERDLISAVETALGRDVPKFDVREAVYRAALRNQDDVVDELARMGYTLDEE